MPMTAFEAEDLKTPLDDIERTFFELFRGDIEVEAFERWVYSEPRLEARLSADDYVDLLALSYQTPDALYEAKKLLEPYVDFVEYCEWDLRRTMAAIVERSDDAPRQIARCYDLYCDDYDFLRDLGLGYGLAVSEAPFELGLADWDEMHPADQNRQLHQLYPHVAEEAQAVLDWLDSGQIVLTHCDADGLARYEDTRSAEEKAERTYRDLIVRKKPWWKFW